MRREKFFISMCLAPAVRNSKTHTAPRVESNRRRIALTLERLASAAIATDFVLEFDACMQRIEHFSRAGSLRYAELLDVDGLRFVIVNRYPHLVFYSERRDYLGLVRVLHQLQDIPATLPT